MNVTYDVKELVMMKKWENIKLIDSKTYVIPLLIIVILFSITGYFLISTIRTYIFAEKDEESNRFVQQYTSRLTHATGAFNIIRELVDEKLLVAGGEVVNNPGVVNQEYLKEIADKFGIDDIYWYNSKGEIIYSNTGEYIGWQAYEGHPIYDFMDSNAHSLVEDIRADSESGIYYKYSYLKADDGHFVQVGVLADRSYDLFNRFSIKSYIQMFSEFEDVVELYFIDNNLNITESSNSEKIGSAILDESEKAAVMERRLYSTREMLDGLSVSKKGSPIFVEGIKVGTLVVHYSLEKTEALINQVTIIVFLVLFFAFVVLITMISAIVKRNTKLMYLAYNDPLTNLPNKEYLSEILKQELGREVQGKKAIVLVNCCNFKTVNLTLGHQNGDRVLIELANKLSYLRSEKVALFRFNSDRFVFVIKDYNHQQYLIEFCNKISAIFKSPFQISDVSKKLTARIGIVEINEKDKDINELLKNVEIAISHVETNDQKNYCFFNETMEEDLLRHEIIEGELRKAILNNNSEIIFLDYQPQINLMTNKIIGLEALARMNSKELGRVSPIEFIHIAEKRQLIIPLGELILREACGFIKDLESQGHNQIKVAVNISVIQLLNEDFFLSVINIITESGIDATSLELEITETILMDNYTIINDRLHNLREKGIKIALDDFGTGYSSLARIRELNIDSIKIDKTFIDNILKENHEEVIIRDIISLAHLLGLEVVAEGVEVLKQKEYLILSNCDTMQGYLFSRPVSNSTVISLLNDNKYICLNGKSNKRNTITEKEI